jgi:hypothetical protein
LPVSSGNAVARTDYDTTELSTEVGDVLEVVAEDLISSWLWCRSRDSREGWAPIETLDTAS